MKIKPLVHYSLFILVMFFLPLSAANAACEGKRMVVLGDSLVAGFGLAQGQAFPEQLAVKLKEKGYGIKVVNAGVSGDTTSAGLSRLEWSVGDNADLVLLELGGNDALRGIPVEVTLDNLNKMISKLKANGTEVILAGMLAPPNMGKQYGDAFNAIYPELAEKHDITLYPFFLDGVAADPTLNLDDGFHPNSKGIGVIVERILPMIEGVLGEVCG